MSSTTVLIKNIADTKYEALPSSVTEAAKKQTLDTLGAMIASSKSSMKDLAKLVKEWGGKEESSIIVFGGKVPTPEAAFINGALSVRLDYDDTHLIDWNHPSRTTVPTGLAVAERQGKVTGKDFITAVSLGVDLQCRISRSRSFRVVADAPWVGVFGAATVAGKIMGFDEKLMNSAFGMAYEQLLLNSGGGVFGGNPTKGLSAGLMCKAGVTAALLASKGFSSDGEGSLEGPRGLYKSLCEGLYRPNLLTLDLGKDFRGTTVSQKLYPCTHTLATSVEAAISLARDNDIKPEDIAEIVIHTGPFHSALFGKESQKPPTVVIAQLSGAFCVASAIIHCELNLNNFTEEEIRNAKILQLAEKIKGKTELELNRERVDDPVIVDIKTNSGSVSSKRVENAYGSPERPSSLDDVTKKFRHCCDFAGVAKDKQDKVVKMVKGLEDVADVGEIIRLLA